ncbi:MAG: hypothetical protein INR73_11455 [Williamsia sp.]|nr:hypothetical protein [Williamsia sp.]
MATQSENERKENKSGSTSKPDPGTLHTTDPQEHMEGPVSSLMNNTKEGFEENDAEKKDDEVKNS